VYIYTSYILECDDLFITDTHKLNTCFNLLDL